MGNARPIGLRALVADDEPMLLDLVAAVVANLGIDVTRAVTGGELLEHIAENGPFDVVITDISMPWMTGLQALFSAAETGWRCPIVVMTALRNPKISLQVSALGAGAVLLYKPFSLAQLYAALEAVTGNTARFTPERAASPP